MRMREVVEALDLYTANQKVLVATGVGTHQSVVARHFTFDYPDRILLTSCGHGTMGSGLGYLIGAALEMPDHLPLLITGDGSWEAGDCLSWPTVLRLRLPMRVYVLANGSFGIVRQFEDLNGIRNVATKLPPYPTTSAGLRVEMPLRTNGPMLVRIPVEDYGVWPILEASHGPDDMTQEGESHG